ncbi:MAG TPA: LysM peptidoglycan-binding domain-containing M23 family metallopeptidase [Chloroflexota bacterium]|nr:LysM peptidoglycan-binding domain-containing M23 family metallopeptidase [Chloroflexota bacterium]
MGHVRSQARRWAVLCLCAGFSIFALPSVAAARPSAAVLLMQDVTDASTSRGLVSTYQVQPGDSLIGIGDLLADDPDTIQQLNDLANPNALQAGQLLVVPDAPTTKVRYGVAKPEVKVNTNGAPAFIWPAIGPITTPFGVPGSDWIGGYHMGLDIGAPSGAPIVAAADGVVEEAGMDTQHGYGNHVLINHGNGYETLYAHMSHIEAKVGEKVKQGDLIGNVGMTGFASGPHLHFEVRHDGVKIDPAPLLP